VQTDASLNNGRSFVPEKSYGEINSIIDENDFIDYV